MRILVTGASGLLGLNLSLIAMRHGHEVVGWINTRTMRHAPFLSQTHDLYDLGSIADAVDAAEPDLIINCAAMANLETAEANPDLAFRINAQAAAEIAATALKLSVPVVHISTDAVFDGVRGDYSEEDLPHPINVYASSKLAGEQAVAKANPLAIIARVNFYGWSLSGTRSLAEFFYNRLSEARRAKDGAPVNGFTDVFFCPLYVGQLAELLLDMVDKDLHGLYHVVSSEKISKYDFGVSIARKFGLDEELITPISVKASELQAVRSLNLTLQTTKLEAALGRQLPNQSQALEAFHAAWKIDLPAILKACL